MRWCLDWLVQTKCIGMTAESMRVMELRRWKWQLRLWGASIDDADGMQTGRRAGERAVEQAGRQIGKQASKQAVLALQRSSIVDGPSNGLRCVPISARPGDGGRTRSEPSKVPEFGLLRSFHLRIASPCPLGVRSPVELRVVECRVLRPAVSCLRLRFSSPSHRGRERKSLSEAGGAGLRLRPTRDGLDSESKAISIHIGTSVMWGMGRPVSFQSSHPSIHSSSHLLPHPQSGIKPNLSPHDAFLRLAHNLSPHSAACCHDIALHCPCCLVSNLSTEHL